MSERAKAPWTAEQVQALCARQQFGHPYTCPAHSETALEPTLWGWACGLAGCGYRQDWALASDMVPPNGPRLRCELCSTEHTFYPDMLESFV